MRQYRLAIPAGGGGGAVAPHRVTYLGREAGPSNRPCAVCGREDRGSHEFVEGDPDNPKWVWEIGSGCLRKCTITPEAATEGQMGSMREVFEAIEESDLAVAMRLGKGGLGLHVIKYPSGSFGFTGSVPVALGYTNKDGSPLSAGDEEEAMKEVRYSVPGGVGGKHSKFKTRSWKTAKEALVAAKKAGYDVADDADARG
jgi:hypothetical protein